MGVVKYTKSATLVRFRDRGPSVRLEVRHPTPGLNPLSRADPRCRVPFHSETEWEDASRSRGECGRPHRILHSRSPDHPDGRIGRHGGPVRRTWKNNHR